MKYIFIGDAIRVHATSPTLNTLRAAMIMLICAGSLIAPSVSYGAQLKQETLTFWTAYLQTPRLELSPQPPFLWVEQTPGRLRRVRDGEILVSPVGEQSPEPDPSGLIHDWIGAAFIPHATIEDVLSTVRDYDNYKWYYQPTVVDSKLLSRAGACETYSMRVVNKDVVAQTALDIEYETCYFRIDERRWHSIMRTTRVQEIRHYGQADELELRQTVALVISAPLQRCPPRAKRRRNLRRSRGDCFKRGYSDSATLVSQSDRSPRFQELHAYLSPADRGCGALSRRGEQQSEITRCCREPLAMRVRFRGNYHERFYARREALIADA